MPQQVKDSKETTVTIVVELNVEELEEVIAPRISLNHNETLVNEEIELSIEGLKKG